MIVIIDADYNEETHRGHVAGILSDTAFDEHAKGVVTAIVENIGEYIPGQFFKRELQCVEAILKQLDLSKIDLIIVDGYADFGTKVRSLGAYVYEEYHLPVIGIAKNPFKKCVLTNIEVLRAESMKPLFVTSKGIKNEEAKNIVRKMAGSYRLPDFVKLADQYARNWEC